MTDVIEIVIPVTRETLDGARGHFPNGPDGADSTGPEVSLSGHPTT